MYKAQPLYVTLRQLKPVHNSILCYFLNRLAAVPSATPVFQGQI